ncbi:hypothetical protein CONCODRAFT_4996 [Conidiobolus coronatus NRRL 28638]|uniref:Uncharacterized protein n=1 Tax=Conidiobolus coronatus (strain ATCC 28846 / CBS 209.66 / NRRL 28638) TaxID=796925 RepID=A0A137PBD9_CONC2|nr:hypothetical protein CONCODRAFT_4996 [Conidiobolus coronatus NRRL 28638]|eukprot:KXN72251.1 hypothetical protein CONCODRAFT_4996 [Conidiobolus coronatus NRRL 28638]
MTTLKHLQNQFYYEESEVDIINLTTSIGAISLESYGSRNITYITKDIEYFDDGSVTQVEYYSKYEERTTFAHVKYDNAIEVNEAYEDERDYDDTIRYIESNEPSNLSYGHELEVEGMVDYHYDDENVIYYDHEELYSKESGAEYYNSEDENGDVDEYEIESEDIDEDYDDEDDDDY